MGRTLIYTAIAGLAAFIVLIFVVFQRGGGSSEAVTRISVHDLSMAPETYADGQVETTGVLRRLMAPQEHFLVTDEGLGVLIRGYDPSALRELDGRPVTVSGRFGYNGSEGTYIEAESVIPR